MNTTWIANQLSDVDDTKREEIRNGAVYQLEGDLSDVSVLVSGNGDGKSADVDINGDVKLLNVSSDSAVTLEGDVLEYGVVATGLYHFDDDGTLADYTPNEADV